MKIRARIGEAKRTGPSVLRASKDACATEEKRLGIRSVRAVVIARAKERCVGDFGEDG